MVGTHGTSKQTILWFSVYIRKLPQEMADIHQLVPLICYQKIEFTFRRTALLNIASLLVTILTVFWKTDWMYSREQILKQ